MCGRFVLKSSGDDVADLLALPSIPALSPRYNIAPTQTIWAARIDQAGGERRLVPLRWGLIPHWAKDAGIGARLINARSETAAEKPAFRGAFRRRRCLVPADGYYEWSATPAGKQPYFIRRCDGQAFAIAGLYEAWTDADGKPTESCALLTTRANEELAQLHDRMPVILERGAHQDWLDPTLADAAHLSALLTPAPRDALRADPVSRRVNNPRNDDPRCIETLSSAGAQPA